MSVLVFSNPNEGSFAKSALEACTYGAKVAKALGTDCHAVTYGQVSDAEIAKLGAHGATVVHKAGSLETPDSGQLSKLIATAAAACNSDVILCSHDLTGKAVAPRLSARLKAGLVTGANALPTTDGGFKVNKPVFSGKAFATEVITSAKKVISLMPNSIPPENTGGTAQVQELAGDFGAKKVTVKETKKRTGTISLPDAEKVVSAGRGLKGPENWGMIEELASLLGAATACSRPVADIGWRPHHEHVGQTGVAIRPNLYFAIGISGAIQHLAGVNGSKVIVVINTDPEAPFFKAADYGVVGDAFQVVPKLTEALKAFKG
jgi:electron transfer flavoprotein alpha subunit